MVKRRNSPYASFDAAKKARKRPDYAPVGMAPKPLAPRQRFSILH